MTYTTNTFLIADHQSHTCTLAYPTHHLQRTVLLCQIRWYFIISITQGRCWAEAARPGPQLENIFFKKSKKPDHFYTTFHIVMLNIATLTLYSWSASEALIQNLPCFTYLCLHMYVWYHVINWLNDYVSLLFLMRVRFSDYQPSSY